MPYFCTPLTDAVMQQAGADVAGADADVVPQQAGADAAIVDVVPQQAGADADVAKLADAPDLGSGAVRHVGSTPIIRTLKITNQEQVTSKFSIPCSLFFFKINELNK